MLTIDRKTDTRATKCVLHRVADIPGGVTIKTANLGGDAILEGTPVAVGENGLFEVVKSALVVVASTGPKSELCVAKNHHFIVNDKIAGLGFSKATITSIDKSNPEYDVIKYEGTATVHNRGAIVYECNDTTGESRLHPTAIIGSSYTILPNSNIFCDAWVIGVVRASLAPAVTPNHKSSLKGIVYV